MLAAALKKIISTIEVFDSVKPMDIVDWVSRWKHIISIVRLSPEEAVAYMMSKLSPNLQTILWQKQIQTCEEVWQYLLVRFDNDKYGSAFTQLIEIKQENLKTAAQLHIHIEALAVKAEVERNVINEKSLVQVFVKVLQDLFHSAMVLFPTILNDAVNCVTDVEFLTKTSCQQPRDQMTSPWNKMIVLTP